MRSANQGAGRFGEDPPSSLQMAATFLLCPYKVERDGESSGHSSFSSKDTNCIMGALSLVTSSRPNYLLKVASKTIAFQVGA